VDVTRAWARKADVRRSELLALLAPGSYARRSGIRRALSPVRRAQSEAIRCAIAAASTRVGCELVKDVRDVDADGGLMLEFAVGSKLGPRFAGRSAAQPVALSQGIKH